LDITLYTRSPDGLEPTAAALSLRAEAEALASAADALFRAASGPLAENAGTVRITASEVIAAEALGPILATIQQEHPRIVLELAVSNRIGDLLRRDADVAVRMARPVQTGLVAKRLGKVELGLYAHPDYLSRRGTPKTPADLDAHAIIGFDTAHAYTRTFSLEGKPVTRERFSLRSDSDMGQLAAIRSGCGIGVCHGPIAHRAGLVRLLRSSFAPQVEMWLAMHQDLKTTARYRTVFDGLATGLAGYLRTDKRAASAP
jgi:DNA-binding transcriptional LysR family regulator